jgi:hypothetical protein
MSRRQDRNRQASVLILVVFGIIAAMGYGIAQSTVVTQAEWAVYMVRALNLDWNLPPNPKSNHYIERLNWRSGIEFAATSLESGSSRTVRVDSQVDLGFIEAQGPAAEAMYRVSTIRPGEYGFRLKLANGGAVVKVGSAVFEAFQPENDFRWVDLDRVSLDPGDHTLSLLLNEGTRTQTIGVTPPCLISIEPNTGWQPLVPLTFSDLAVTVAQALDLEMGLPELGQEISIKGEEFTRLLEVPIEEDTDENDSPDPFWLSSGNMLLTAETRFDISEPGLYTLEARYFSPKEIRWIVDGCLRVITCPVSAQGGVKWTSVVAIQLEAGSHDLTITMPPNASLDRLTIKQRDGSIEEYLGVASDEGFKLGDADEPVSRRRAIAAAVRLRSLFDRWKAARCNDSLIALDELSALIMAAGSGGSGQEGSVLEQTVVPGVVVRTPMDDGDNPVFPTPGGDPDVSSPTRPGQ